MNGRADFRRNNLDCLRLILASTVALFHVSALTNLPAFSALGTYLSPHFAVRSFFVISGLLIYRSYDRSSSPGSYFEKRARRIYPAYFAVVALAAIGLSALSTISFSRYFGVAFWKYLGANLLFLNFLAPSLPGVFRGNPVSGVDGALWTLKIEVAFYLSVPLIHSLCKRIGATSVLCSIFLLSCLWKYGFGFLASLHDPHAVFSADPTRNLFSQLQVQFPGEFMYFMAGILILLWFDRLASHFRAIACLTACVFLLDHFVTRGVLDVVWISGIVIVFGFWRYFGNFAKYGDFSYGVYIVHWPILQILIAFRLDLLNPALFLPISFVSIGTAAVLLWNLVERRFLASSSHYREVSSGKRQQKGSAPSESRAVRAPFRWPGVS